MRYLSLILLTASALIAANEGAPTATFKQYCLGCHGKAAMGGINLEALSSGDMAAHYQQWEKVAEVLDQNRMPPPKLPRPDEAQRAQASAWIKAELKQLALRNAGDPGKVTVRRMTSAEYGYALLDLTGVEFKFDREFATDTVGGEGFTNFGDTQFMADANLERYLEAAKRVADHAVIGAGPLAFFEHPGKSGFELSAIHRIRDIYRDYGFRSASGEGGKPYGLERYGKAFFAAWQYKHRAALGKPAATMAALAKSEGVTARFLEHIWSVLQQPDAPYPASEVIARWKKLPAPNVVPLATVRAQTVEIQNFTVNWARWMFGAGALAEGGLGDERALVINEESVQAKESDKLRYAYINRNRDQGPRTVRVYLMAVSVNPAAKEKPVVIWRNPTLRMRTSEKAFGPARPLREIVDAEAAARLGFGKHPAGGDLPATDLATGGEGVAYFDVPIEKGSGTFGFEVQPELATATGAGDAVIRCTVSDSQELSKGRPMSVLLAHPRDPGYLAWRKGVLRFGLDLPAHSQTEAAPSDRDPIPPPFNTAYNQPERDRFHVTVKYHRNDQFLVEKMLDEGVRKQLDAAWMDLLGSFDYHDVYFNFIKEKYNLGMPDQRIGKLTAAEIAALPAEARAHVVRLRAEYDAVQKAHQAAQPGHLEDALKLAASAWRRPLTPAEKDRLRSFYIQSRESAKLDHTAAMRALIARILVAPNFLFRLENAASVAPAKEQALGAWEIASRLSFLLWSSVPDAELRRAASAGELANRTGLEKQVKRMTADPKVRRFAAEFFGQWLGFYRFDQYTGVDTGRFPEFDQDLKDAMYNEAISLFEYIVRQDRPVREVLFADYTFLNARLAKHYGVGRKIEGTERVAGANSFGRGGALRLGSVLTATSAPLRTSPVKRGDWLLRRILGTPTPPPPADAGSIPADDKAFGGLSLKEKLQAHQRNATCAGCHSRIDPLGFPLENYDAVGRLRATYADGKPVITSSEMPGDRQIEGVDGLLSYLKTQDRQVQRTFARKLLGYALGRTVQLSDQPLLDQLTTKGGEAKMSEWITGVVLSKQFRYRREQTAPAPQAAGGE